MIGLVVLGLIGASVTLFGVYAKHAAPVPPDRRRRVRLALGALLGLWLFSLFLIWTSAQIAQVTEGRDGLGLVPIVPFAVSGPIAYAIGRRQWMLLLPVLLLAAWAIAVVAPK